MATIAALAISGCNPCFNVECDAPDIATIDGLLFRFDTESSFTSSQTDSAYIMLFEKGDWDNPIDSYSYEQDMMESDDNSFMLKVGYPFAQVQDLSLWNYVIFPNGGEVVFRISSVRSQGYYPEDCCCCYRNRLKTFKINSSSIERSGSDEAVLLRQ